MYEEKLAIPTEIVSDSDLMETVFNILFSGGGFVCFKNVLPQMFNLCIATIFLYLYACEINVEKKTLFITVVKKMPF